jgi:hypothetical protein
MAAPPHMFSDDYNKLVAKDPSLLLQNRRALEFQYLQDRLERLERLENYRKLEGNPWANPRGRRSAINGTSLTIVCSNHA